MKWSPGAARSPAGRIFEVLQKIIDGTPEPLAADVPAPLRTLVDKALQKAPAGRYQSMRELVADLRALPLQAAEEAAPRRKTLPRRWAAAAVLALIVGAGAWKLWPRAPQIRSIAVLPLQNLSGDPSQEYFSDGTTEALISSLAQVRALKVISRTSVMRFKGTTKALPEIARELGVDAIVEGAVQRSGGRVRVSAQLIRAATDEHLWAKDYDRDVVDVLALEDEVARAIAQEIRVQVTPQESQRLQRPRRVAAAAQDAYFQGRYHLWKLDDEDLKEAVRYFEDATRIQPDFAEAYAGLSHAWHERGIWGAVDFRETEGPIKNAARKALELDRNLADAHTALGDALYAYDWNWKDAGTELRRGIDLDPNSIEVHSYYSAFLMAAGRFPEAIQEAERAASIDPVSSTMQSNYARILFRARKYGDAERHFKKALELDSQDFTAYTRLAEVYEQTGRLQEAQSFIEQGLRIRGANIVKAPALARIYALRGKPNEALRILDQAPKLGSAGREQEFALVYFALGDEERGFEWLTKAFDERGFVIFVKFDPRFDSVRSDPRFQALVARLGIPDVH